MRPWIRSYQLFLDFCPWRAFLPAPASPCQPLPAPGSYKARLQYFYFLRSASTIFLFFAYGVYNIFIFCVYNIIIFYVYSAVFIIF